MPPTRPGRLATLFTIAVFILLASIDNAVLEMAPSIFWAIKPALSATDVEIGIANSILIWTTATTAIPWGYLGDRTNRKRLLLYGTLIWASGALLAPLADLPAYFALQAVMGAGLGCIASVGFSIISDLVSPARRGLAMSAWSLSQGIGTAVGKAIAAIVVTRVEDWWVPYVLFSATGFLLVVLYGFTANPARGATEEELQGTTYTHVIKPGDLVVMLRRPSNLGLILHGGSLQLFWGAFSWLPFVMAIKLAGVGLPEGVAGLAGNVILAAFFAGGFIAPAWGWLGDRVRRRRLNARPLLVMVGTSAGAILFLLAMAVPFEAEFVALAGLSNPVDVILAIVQLILGSPAVLAFFVLAFLAMAGFCADLPNTYALGIDVNLPEHRGTMFSLVNFVLGIGRGAGAIIVPVVATALQPSLPEPANYIAAITLMLLALVPAFTGMAIQVRHAARDATGVRATLRARVAGPATGAGI